MQTFINERVYKIKKEETKGKEELAAAFFHSRSIYFYWPPQFLSDRSDSIQFLIHTANPFPTSSSSSSCYLKRIIYQIPP
jgi:hypothetical protein